MNELQTAEIHFVRYLIMASGSHCSVFQSQVRIDTKLFPELATGRMARKFLKVNEVSLVQRSSLTYRYSSCPCYRACHLLDAQ